MDKRIKLGIIFGYSEGHIAVTYYIQNILRSLALLDDNDKPEITIFCRSDLDFSKAKITGYPYLSQKKLHFDTGLILYINKVTKVIFKNSYLGFAYKASEVDLLFPGSDMSCFRKIKKKLYWAGDFQDLFFSNNFSKKILLQRKLYRSRISYNKSNIVFSSVDNLDQYNDHFPDNNANKFVYQFTVINPDISHIDSLAVLEKYNVSVPFFVTPNQFWIHKNHEVLLNACLILKKQDVEFQLILTGKEDDGKDGSYIKSLKERVIECGLEDNIKFLGFIDRIDLLVLIQASEALVQPSFYEGWNTSIEDGKYFDKIVLASDLKVHREQLASKGMFFDPNKPKELATLMRNVLSKKDSKTSVKFNYKEIILKQASTFINIIKEVVKQ